jgi:hypothetical protein
MNKYTEIYRCERKIRPKYLAVEICHEVNGGEYETITTILCDEPITGVRLIELVPDVEEWQASDIQPIVEQ